MLWLTAVRTSIFNTLWGLNKSGKFLSDVTELKPKETYLPLFMIEPGLFKNMKI